jgi:cytoskeletal protein CcmA (bactofilin family)
MTSSSGVKRSLEDRVVLCTDCDANRTLSLSNLGNLVCSTCGSSNWMYLPVTANVKETVYIKGELIVDEDLTIEGRVEGKIDLKNHNLWIGPHGTVNANVHAKSAIIAGHLIGNISASELVEIKLSGSMLGNITCPRVSIVEGAKFKGMIDTGTMAETTTKSHDPHVRVVSLSQSASSGIPHSKP